MKGHTIFIDDTAVEHRWGDYRENALEHGVHSSMGMPIPLPGKVSAALNIFATEPNAFDGHTKDLAATFASYATVALTNMHVYDNARQLANHLQIAMKSRSVIEQAKGMLMSERHCSAQEAFDILVAASQRTNRKVRDVATDMVESVNNRANRRANGG